MSIWVFLKKLESILQLALGAPFSFLTVCKNNGFACNILDAPKYNK